MLAFTRYTFRKYRADRAHALICKVLDQVVRTGKPDRLMIFMGPQMGKSELVSVRLPAFWLGRKPDDSVMLASYGASLAHAKAREARAVVEGVDYREVFPEVGTDRTSRDVSHWRVAGRRGSMVSAGVGGPLTGFGAELALIDDPLENWEQAQSPRIRDKVWDWWRGTFRTRVREGGAVVLIQTRWHEDDLGGRLLKDQPGRWAVLRLPAIAETQEERDMSNELLGLPTGKPDPIGRGPGEPLCPSRFSLEALNEIRGEVGERVWWAEYQGVPRPLDGAWFNRGWFGVVEKAPAVASRVRYWDKASTDSEGAAYTAGVLIAQVGARHERLWFVEDVVRGRWSSREREQVILQTAQVDRQRFGDGVEVVVEQEPGSSGVDSAAATIANLAGFNVAADRVTGDKNVRLEPFRAQCEGCNVKLVAGAWNAAWLDEVCAVPTGTYRDQVDASAGAFNRLAARPDEWDELLARAERLGSPEVQVAAAGRSAVEALAEFAQAVARTAAHGDPLPDPRPVVSGDDAAAVVAEVMAGCVEAGNSQGAWALFNERRRLGL